MWHIKLFEILLYFKCIQTINQFLVFPNKSNIFPFRLTNVHILATPKCGLQAALPQLPSQGQSFSKRSRTLVTFYTNMVIKIWSVPSVFSQLLIIFSYSFRYHYKISPNNLRIALWAECFKISPTISLSKPMTGTWRASWSHMNSWWKALPLWDSREKCPTHYRLSVVIMLDTLEDRDIRLMRRAPSSSDYVKHHW